MQYKRGLDTIKRLMPITFDWQGTGLHDVGFSGEEVAAVDQLLVTHADNGSVGMVKHDRIAAVLVSAVKEQQEIIEAQQAEINALKLFICTQTPSAEFCKPRN
jgi:hypothetical protein